jgi:hypothetical protein
MFQKENVFNKKIDENALHQTSTIRINNKSTVNLKEK